MMSSNTPDVQFHNFWHYPILKHQICIFECNSNFIFEKQNHRFKRSSKDKKSNKNVFGCLNILFALANEKGKARG